RGGGHRPAERQVGRVAARRRRQGRRRAHRRRRAGALSGQARALQAAVQRRLRRRDPAQPDRQDPEARAARALPGPGTRLSARTVAESPGDAPDRAYARYVLGVLIVVYVFNFLDRQIISILAERIKADLGLRDDQIGFLYGTAFAVFYALFGLPLGRLADGWIRTRVIACGLGVWSVMTTASGLARSFAQLAVARVGVGVGEASANPAAFSLITD